MGMNEDTVEIPLMGTVDSETGNIIWRDWVCSICKTPAILREDGVPVCNNPKCGWYQTIIRNYLDTI
jgi:hypothetical protein